MPSPTPAQLAAEITTDPTARGYAGMSDWEQAGSLNALTAATVWREYVDVADVVACIVRTEYDTLTAVPKAFLTMILSGTRVKTGDANMRTSLGSVFPTGATRTALLAVASRPASRAEALWGSGVVINDVEVARAFGRGL